MNFDWENFFTTLFATGFGAWGAYCFSIKRAKDELKCNEKAKLLKLFYDINILTKTYVYHHENCVAQINNLTKSNVMSCTPITIKDNNLDIDEYGFLTKLSPKLYEMLTYVHHDISYVCEQEDIATEFLCQEVCTKDYLIKLEHIKISTLKLLAKLYVSLININSLSAKYYECENLIKEEVANSYIRAKKVMDKCLNEYKEILNNPKSKKKMDEEDLKTIQVDSEYINEILDTWVLDFKLNKKQKIKIDGEISKEVEKKWEAPENDL